MYPGVPLVSCEFSAFSSLAIPMSVICTYPFSSSTRFSGLMSLWITLLLCKYSNPMKMQATKNSKAKYLMTNKDL